jgi:hypothetical protein
MAVTVPYVQSKDASVEFPGNRLYEELHAEFAGKCSPGWR